MIPLPNFRARATEWLEHESRDTAFVLGVAALLVAVCLVAPPVWLVDSIWLRFGMGLLLGEWVVRIYRWAKWVRQARIDRAENNALCQLILRAHDLHELRLRFAALLASRGQAHETKYPRRPRS